MVRIERKMKKQRASDRPTMRNPDRLIEAETAGLDLKKGRKKMRKREFGFIKIYEGGDRQVLVIISV